MSAGIDYSGPNGTCNRGPTGIRFGILPVNCENLSDWFWEQVEPHYTPYCPHCGSELDDNWDGDECPHCGQEIDDGDQWPDEPDSNILVSEDETGFVDDSNDIWITDSKYYTHAQFCSPCAPGACYLSNPCEDGAKAYCLGPDWFNGNPPYPIYLVKNGEKL